MRDGPVVVATAVAVLSCRRSSWWQLQLRLEYDVGADGVDGPAAAHLLTLLWSVHTSRRWLCATPRLY